jgi:hypothetical protein
MIGSEASRKKENTVESTRMAGATIPQQKFKKPVMPKIKVFNDQVLLSSNSGC